MTKTPVQAKRTKFTDPPINELVISLFHLPIVELRSQHIGMYWNIIRERFPDCQQQPPVPAFVEVPGELFPLPRFWFQSDQSTILIQVQRNAFMLNWRRNVGKKIDEYPHYEAVSNQFWQEFEVYASFVRDSVGAKIDVIERCELNYTNLITQNELFSSPVDAANILPFLSSMTGLPEIGHTLEGANATFAYRVDDDTLVDVTVRLGRRADDKTLALGYELKAHGRPKDLSPESARAWLDSAHDATYQVFLKTTSKEAQGKLWKPR